MTIQLLIHSPLVGGLDQTSFGGFPVRSDRVPFAWPHCEACANPMRYLGKIASGGELVLIFMCGADPGMCDEWDAEAGANKAIKIPKLGLSEVTTVPEGETLLGISYGAMIVIQEDDDYDEARTAFAQESGLPGRVVLGQLLGSPAWIQGDETPSCNTCGQKMRLLAQLEQGPDHAHEMNFGGGGCAYVFDCKCEDSAKFLWQC